MKVNEAVAIRMNELLNKNNVTYYALAKKMGMDHSTLGSILRKDLKDNKLSTIILIANGFDMEVSEFLSSPLFSLNNLDI